jgi:hypothetical protein
MTAALLLVNVVLVTLDGVGREDFLDPARLPLFWSRRAAEGLVLPGMEVADPSLVSLPAYQSIFAGALTGCAGNDCGRVREETFPERLLRELSLPRAGVAVFASWEKIAEAVEHAPGAITVDAGPHSWLPWRDSRPDEETFALALRYLATERPRFLYLALGDADELAHNGDREGYRAALSRYDQWLEALLRQLDSMGDYGKQTAVIVTTDHGRGEGERWTGHGGEPHARFIWLFARGPGIAPGTASRRATHLELRPTIEALFGLCSAHAPIEEIARPACEKQKNIHHGAH